MTSHVIAGNVDPADLALARGPWLKVSAAFTDALAELTERENLTVTCAPGAGQGSPGCFIPSRATIELDGTHLGHPPGTCDPARPSDRDRYPALWGVYVHEIAHADHSRWTIPTSALPADVTAAFLLEESRIEAVCLRERPALRRWLRASTTQLVMRSFAPDPASEPPTSGAGISADMTPWDAGCAAALILARVSAGVLDEDETTDVAAAVCKVLSPSRLSALAALWHIAQRTDDDDAKTMLDLGARWCRILDVDPHDPNPGAPRSGTHADEDEESQVPSELAAAIASALGAVANNDNPPPSKAPQRARANRQAEREAQNRSRQAARDAFASRPTPASRGHTRITGTRPPTPAEQAAARRLARALRTAAHRERAATQSTSPTPPGRLRMREALAADAQRAAGAVPTAEPFLRTERRHVPAPPLRVGIACDVSASMGALAHPLASTAWILSRATSHVPDAQAAAVIFGEYVRALTRPGRVPARVHEFAASDFTESFVEAVDALDGALDLSRAGAARLLVVVSDGMFTTHQRSVGQQRVQRLTGSGCAVLWLSLDHTDPMEGTHLLTLTDPADAADTIGRAAVRALRDA